MFDSGITTLNLAITGKPNEFSAPGNTVRLCGESDAGKTVLALTIQAASFYACKGAIRPVFYPFEPNLLIDIERLYGKKFAKALQIVDVNGMSAEMWQADIRKKFKDSKLPMIAVTDSTDAMKTNAELDAADGAKAKKDKKDKGEVELLEGVDETELGSTESGILRTLRKTGVKAGMGTTKPLLFSLTMPLVCSAAAANGGLNILLSQVREKTGVVFGNPLFTSGGRAVGHGSETTIWVHKSTRETVGDVLVGGWTRVEVKRNKVTGDARTIFAPIYPIYGIDDTRAMLHFLADTGSGAEWANKTGMEKITVGGEIVDGKRVGGQTMTLAEMAAHFEGEGTKDVLKKMVTDAWAAREARLTQEVLAGRKPRFS